MLRGAALARAMRDGKAGSLLSKTVTRGRTGKGDTASHLPDGIDRKQSSRWQALARIPDEGRR